MKAMILAAGRGERMRPLTDHIPKPLLQVCGKALIDYCLDNLVSAGFTDIVINIAHLGQQIRQHCGNGSRWGVQIHYSDEGDSALETAGGIAHALPLLGEQPFVVINADVLCNYPLQRLRQCPLRSAHLVLIDNPPHHPQGDFHLGGDGVLSEDGQPALTFSGIGIYQPQLFQALPAGPLKLRPVLAQAMQQQAVTAEHHRGLWLDIGTPERLAAINVSGLPLA